MSYRAGAPPFSKEGLPDYVYSELQSIEQALIDDTLIVNSASANAGASNIIIANSSAALTSSIYLAASAARLDEPPYRVINRGPGTVIVKAPGIETINGSGSATLSAQFSQLVLYTDGTNYYGERSLTQEASASLQTQITALSASLQTNIDTLSANLEAEIVALSATLESQIRTLSASLQAQVNSTIDQTSGAWTPALLFTGEDSNTYSVQRGYYERNGNIVLAYGEIQLSEIGDSATGQATISNFPFTAAENETLHNSVTIGSWSFAEITVGAHIAAILQYGGDAANLRVCNPNGPATNLIREEVSSTFHIYFSSCYRRKT